MSEPLTIDSPQALVNRVRFSGKDFFTFVDDLISRIQLLFVTEFNDFISSGTGQMLIDMTSWAAETLSFYIDRQATESYLETARFRRSVNRLCRQVGYKMNSASSSSVDLEITLTEARAFDVPIPVGFQFQGPNELVFEATETITFPAGEGPTSTPRTLSVREGTTKIQKFKGTGEKNQRFRLTPSEGKWVAGEVSVTVDGAVWDESVFISYDATDQYEIDYNSEPSVLRFGDGVAGNVPASGVDVVVTYVETSGANGKVLQGTINDVVTPLVVAFTDIGLNVTNPDGSSGGSPPESLESAKSNAPLYFAARDVAVVESDYIALSQGYSDPVAGSVAVAQAFVALGAEDDLTLQGLLDSIRATTGALESTVNGYVSQGDTDLSTISSLRSDISSQNTAIGTALSNIETAADNASDNTIDAQTEATKIEGDVTAVTAYVNTFAAGATQIQDPEKTALLNMLSGISSKASAAKGYGDTVLTELGTLESERGAAETAQVAIVADLVSMATAITSLQTQLDSIETTMGTDFETAIENDLQAIYDHVDTFLASDCQSNLVQVPILAYDADGFYTSPSTALIRSLENYLDSRKEVTQVVDVVSGEAFLVEAVITGTLGIIEGYVQATVISNVRSAIYDVLRNRAFGASLRLSDIYTSIQPDPQTGVGGVEGVQYAIFSIDGPSEFLDSNGNLIITKERVITLGSLAIVGETAVA